ncbi:hypothetical protein DFR58_105154 [Anaerobacterium chartisolvens]|uniref:Uncharacterized protein n=1 Tax=Anaerobacterium chartisolvens TaxID=1297424 RepID=A0A369BA40_9FIRM|nr:hypothetical protein DFR58_105154 [Anaerobacterium chartisolvens]
MFSIKSLLEIICRVTAISASRLAENYLHKDPAVIVRWKTGRVIPGMEDLSAVAKVASKKSMESQKIQMRKEIENLASASDLAPELKAVILCKADFEEFLLEALSTSVMRRPKPSPCKHDDQNASEIIEAMECIRGRLSYLQEHSFYSTESMQIDLKQVESFTKAVCKLPVKAGLMDGLQKPQKESKLSCGHMQSFYDDIRDICGQYDSLIEFLGAAAQAAASRQDILSCYIEFIRLNTEIIGICTNIACLNGLLALNDTVKLNKFSVLPFKSIPCPSTEEILSVPGAALSCLSACMTQYDKAVLGKANLLERLKAIDS